MRAAAAITFHSLKDKSYRARLGHVQHKLKAFIKLATIIPIPFSDI
jgi:hypothetical protein